MDDAGIMLKPDSRSVLRSPRAELYSIVSLPSQNASTRTQVLKCSEMETNQKSKRISSMVSYMLRRKPMFRIDKVIAFWINNCGKNLQHFQQENLGKVCGVWIRCRNTVYTYVPGTPSI